MVKIKKRKLIVGETEKKIDYSNNKPYLILIGSMQIETLIREIAEKQQGCYTKQQEKKLDNLHKSLIGFSKVFNRNFIINPMNLILNTGIYNKAKSRYKNGENIGFGYDLRYEGVKEVEDLYLSIVFFIGVLEGIHELKKEEVSKYAVNLKIQLFSVKKFLEQEYHNAGAGKEKEKQIVIDYRLGKYDDFLRRYHEIHSSDKKQA